MGSCCWIGGEVSFSEWSESWPESVCAIGSFFTSHFSNLRSFSTSNIQPEIIIFDDQSEKNKIKKCGWIWRCESKASKQKSNHSKCELVCVCVGPVWPWHPWLLARPPGESKIVCIQKISSRISWVGGHLLNPKPSFKFSLSSHLTRIAVLPPPTYLGRILRKSLNTFWTNQDSPSACVTCYARGRDAKE